MSATIYTDGSCIFQFKEVRGHVAKGGRGYGGWAAIVEHGHEGWVVRGSVPDTTNTAMEMRALIEGLLSLPPGVPAAVYTDSTLLLWVYDRWQAKALQPHGDSPGERQLWHKLAAMYARNPCTLQLVRRRDVVRGHQRAHGYAQYEARRSRVELATDETWATGPPVLRADGQPRAAKEPRQVRQGMRAAPGHADTLDPIAVAAARLDRKKRKADGRLYRGTHLHECKPGACAPGCPLWLWHGADVYRSG